MAQATTELTRKPLKGKTETPDAGVLKTLGRFYEAVNRMFAGDVLPLADVWCHTDDVTLLGPCGGIYSGWDAVREEFDRHAGKGVTGRLWFREPLIRVFGDLAYATYVEYGDNLAMEGKPLPIEIRATTIFRREDGQWRVIYHHADRVPGLEESHGGGPK